MICPHCLIDTNTIFGRCSHCGGAKDVFATELHKEIAISGLEKIIDDKLNKVIENQNKIIDYLNGMVKNESYIL